MKKRQLAASFVAVLVVCIASSASAQTRSILSGETRVSLSSGFVSALGTLNVTPGTIYPTRLSGTTVNFPVVGGAIDVNTAKGEILHRGGLTLSTSTKRVRLQAFTIDTTTGKPFISGLVSVNGTLLGRLPLFDLTLPSTVTLPLKPSSGNLAISGVNVKLSAAAAQALNTVFGVSAFKGGFGVGTAKVSFFSYF